jgi:hypothetical protein
MDKFNIAKGFMDQIKFYINPEIYAHEIGEVSEPEKRLPFREEQRKSGMATGYMKSPQEVQDIIKQIDLDKQEDVDRYIFDEDGEVKKLQNFQDEEDTLG